MPKPDMISQIAEAKRLAASPKAQQAHARKARKGLLGVMPGFMVGKSRKGPPQHDPAKAAAARLMIQANPLWSAPKKNALELRQGKEPYGWTSEEKSGGQIQHKPKVFTDVFGQHMTGAQHDAVELLRAGYELLQRARVTSDRAYTGMPFSGKSIERVGHVPLTEKERADLEVFEETWRELTQHTSEWWDRLVSIILHEKDERTGRVLDVGVLGMRLTKYRGDSATAAGVMATNDALIRFLEALQAALLKRQYRRMRRRDEMEAAVTRHAAGERRKRVG